MGRLWTKNLKDLLEIAGSLLAIMFLLALCRQVTILKTNQKTLTSAVQSQELKINEPRFEHIEFREDVIRLGQNHTALLEAMTFLDTQVRATALVINALISPYQKEEADIYENIEFNLWKMEILHGR